MPTPAASKAKRKGKKHFSSNNNNNSFSKSFDEIATPSKSTTSDNPATASPSSSKKRKPRKHPKSLNNRFDKDEMGKYVLWRRPLTTFYYFILELVEILAFYFIKFLTYRKLVSGLCLLIGLIVLGFNIEGAHLPVLFYLRKKVLWCLYWMGLGVASSIGLGTGLHTFLLYLGPFIAQVTLAAYECNSLKFPEPPYPDSIICPSNSTTASEPQQEDGMFSSTAAMAFASSVSILSIMSKLRLESFMWGAGTAIGELPPYFMARASALSAIENHDTDGGDQDEELVEFENLLEAEKQGAQSLNLLDRMRLAVFKVIKKVGFWGILLCASIPNPLFDLAGITCGHFLVKFSTFFGATLIGKAIIKMHIQKMFVIFLFSQHHLNTIFNLIAKIPYVGENMQPIFQEWLNNEKKKLHRVKSPLDEVVTESSESILSWVLNKIVLMMVLFFIVSIVNSLAQRRYKRLNSQPVLAKVACD